jgi:hypothetical protein
MCDDSYALKAQKVTARGTDQLAIRLLNCCYSAGVLHEPSLLVVE